MPEWITSGYEATPPTPSPFQVRTGMPPEALEKLSEGLLAMRERAATPQGPPTAADILGTGVQILSERGKQRDTPQGERTMRRAVMAFNHLFGKDLTVEEGWKFMAVLKLARTKDSAVEDDFVDGANYFALAGEENLAIAHHLK